MHLTCRKYTKPHTICHEWDWTTGLTFLEFHTEKGGRGVGGGAGYHTLVGPFSAKFGAPKMHIMY